MRENAGSPEAGRVTEALKVRLNGRGTGLAGQGWPVGECRT